MNAPARTRRHWLRELRGQEPDWHLVDQGTRTAVCGAELTGPVAAALLPFWGFLPEPACIRCVLWVRGDMASREGREPIRG